MVRVCLNLFFSFFGVISLLQAIAEEVPVPQIVEHNAGPHSIRPQYDPLPLWLVDENHVPLERDLALQKLFYFKYATFEREADYVAQEIVDSMGVRLPPEEIGDALTKENRERLNNRYSVLLELELSRWETEKVRAEIRIEICKRAAREERIEKRLSDIARQLAELEELAETKVLRERLSKALEATDYVSVDGRVLLRDDAYPPFGYTR